MRSDKDKAREALQRVYNVYMREVDSVDTNNGILNTDYIEYQKRRILKEGIKYWTEELVDVKQEFPVDNISEITLTADFVMLKRSDFEKIEKALEDE